MPFTTSDHLRASVRPHCTVPTLPVPGPIVTIDMPLWTTFRRSAAAQRIFGPIPPEAKTILLRDVPGHILFGEACTQKPGPETVFTEWVMTPKVVRGPQLYPSATHPAIEHLNYIEWYSARGRAVIDHLNLQEAQGLHRLHLEYPEEYPQWRRTFALGVALMERHVDHLREVLNGTVLRGGTLSCHLFWLDIRWNELHPNSPELRRDLSHLIRRIALPNFTWTVDFPRRARLVQWIAKALETMELEVTRQLGRRGGWAEFNYFLNRAVSFRKQDIEVLLKRPEDRLSPPQDHAVVLSRRDPRDPLPTPPDDPNDNIDRLVAATDNPFDAVFASLEWAISGQFDGPFQDALNGEQRGDSPIASAASSEHQYEEIQSLPPSTGNGEAASRSVTPPLHPPTGGDEAASPEAAPPKPEATKATAPASTSV